LTLSLAARKRLHMLHDGQPLVGGNHPHRDPTQSCADARTAGVIPGGVEVDSDQNG